MISLMVESKSRQWINKTRQKLMGGEQTGGYQRGRVIGKGKRGAGINCVVMDGNETYWGEHYVVLIMTYNVGL